MSGRTFDVWVGVVELFHVKRFGMVGVVLNDSFIQLKIYLL